MALHLHKRSITPDKRVLNSLPLRSLAVLIPPLIAIVCGLSEVCAAQGSAFDRDEALKLGAFVQAAEKGSSPPLGYALVDEIYAVDPTASLFAGEDVVGYISRSPSSGNDIVVAFRNSKNFDQWLQKSTFDLTSFAAFPSAGRVAVQFSSFYDAARAGSDPPERVLEKLRNLVQGGGVSTIHITGYGLGAVFATLLAADMVGHEIFKNVTVYTFASPRVGDATFASTYDRLVPESWRIANRRDIVPHLPPNLVPHYQHVKSVYEIDPRDAALSITCQLSLQTYLHGLDAKQPLDRECVPKGSVAKLLDAFRGLRERFWWLKPLSWAAGAISTYAIAMLALLLLAWRRGSSIISRNYLISKAAWPLLAAPGLARRVLFFGYTSRLRKEREIAQASKDYFGLPAQKTDGTTVMPDANGNCLHEQIAAASSPQQPVVIVGRGGAGKTTLLARLAFLGLENALPPPLDGYVPILVPAGYYADSLVKAIADTLRERDGVAVTVDAATAQLQSGRFLILFDGLTEVLAENKRISTNEIIRVAANADYRACRFIIATRPTEELPETLPIFKLMPLEPEVISSLLPRYDLGVAGENQVRLQLRSFGSRPLEPLLFTMMLAQSRSNQISQTRASLYEGYFRRLLRVTSDEMLWKGWRAALENLAQWFLLDTGLRGVGLPHTVLIKKIAGVNGVGANENTLDELKRLYRFPLKDPLELVQGAEAAGLLSGGRRWRFRHDTFEEYFAASKVISVFEETGAFPTLDAWSGSAQREQDFLGVIDFVREMSDNLGPEEVAKFFIPEVWKQRLLKEA